MLFPTAVFALFFFVVFNVHWALRRQPAVRKGFLLAASLVFYGYWSWKFALMLLASAWVNHAAARGLAAITAGHAPRRAGLRRGVMAAVLLLNLGALAFFKYAGFVVDDMLLPLLRPLCGWLGQPAMAQLVAFQEWVYPVLSRIVLPVGISFFTFQALSYVIDVYRGDSRPARTWVDFASYLAFFPQLVAGPIVRAGVLVPQMEVLPTVPLHSEAGRAAFLIVAGLFKKTVLANWIATHLADPAFASPEAYSGPDLLLAIYGYAVQIYCDFSAYSDIAIGTALLMGFRFPENFNAPYFAVTLREFWRRWHISLSTWLRDYLYIPLGGSRGTARRTGFNLVVTFVLGGLWHGAAWTFLLWGVLHGVYLVGERWWLARAWLARAWPAWCVSGPGRPVVRALGRLWTFHIVCVSWLLFRGGDMETVGLMVKGLASWRTAVPEVLLWGWTSVLVVGAGLAVQFLDGDRTRGINAWLARRPAWAIALGAALALTLILGCGPEGVAPFIYFQF